MPKKGYLVIWVEWNQVKQPRTRTTEGYYGKLSNVWKYIIQIVPIPRKWSQLCSHDSNCDYFSFRSKSLVCGIKPESSKSSSSSSNSHHNKHRPKRYDEDEPSEQVYYVDQIASDSEISPWTSNRIFAKTTGKFDIGCKSSWSKGDSWLELFFVVNITNSKAHKCIV